MDSTFIPVTITFFTFLIVAYYLNVIRMSIPIVMIYFIYCFSFFINNDKINSDNENFIKEKDTENVKNNGLEESKHITRDTLELTIKKNKYPIDPKPIISSVPKPIVIDSNIISKSDDDINQVNLELPVIEKNTDTINNEKLKESTLTLNEIMICRGIYKRNPIKPGINFINNVDSLFCYTKISNSGNKQEVKHIWYFENKEISTVSYNIKTSYNYRSWSKKTIYPNQTGKWRVDVVTKFGVLLGSRDFDVNSINTTY